MSAQQRRQFVNVHLLLAPSDVWIRIAASAHIPGCSGHVETIPCVASQREASVYSAVKQELCNTTGDNKFSGFLIGCFSHGGRLGSCTV